jgi:hypothetical protein
MQHNVYSWHWRWMNGLQGILFWVVMPALWERHRADVWTWLEFNSVFRVQNFVSCLCDQPCLGTWQCWLAFLYMTLLDRMSSEFGPVSWVKCCRACVGYHKALVVVCDPSSHSAAATSAPIFLAIYFTRNLEVRPRNTDCSLKCECRSRGPE